jgi:transposase
MSSTDARSLSAAAQEAWRRRVVAAVQEGLSQAQAARTFGVSRAAVNGWYGRVQRGGEATLAARKRGRPTQPRLAKAQQRQAVRLIRDRCPDQLKLPFALWTRPAVCQLLQQRFGLKVSVWTAGRYLRAWGFTPQKPLRRAYERDPRKLERWLKLDYPVIRARAKLEKALIYWGDEMGLRCDHQSGTSYGIRGHTPVIAGSGRRFGCQMIWAITNRGQLSFMVFTQRFTTRVFLAFLRRLIRQPRRAGGGRKCFLIVDGHPVHRAAAMQRWLARHPARVELFFLPGHAPQLNPDELLNQDVKANALGPERPADQTQMIGLVRQRLRSTQRRPHVVQSYFQEDHVRYAAA